MVMNALNRSAVGQTVRGPQDGVAVDDRLESAAQGIIIQLRANPHRERVVVGRAPRVELVLEPQCPLAEGNGVHGDRIAVAQAAEQLGLVLPEVLEQFIGERVAGACIAQAVTFHPEADAAATGLLQKGIRVQGIRVHSSPSTMCPFPSTDTGAGASPSPASTT